MTITNNQLRRIIREEVSRMVEASPRGMPSFRGEPRDTDYTRGMAYGRGEGGRRQTMGGRDEYDDFGGGGAEFMQKFSKGDRVMTADGAEAVVIYASEVDSAVRIALEDGSVMTIDGDYLERA